MNDLGGSLIWFTVYLYASLFLASCDFKKSNQLSDAPMDQVDEVITVEFEKNQNGLNVSYSECLEVGSPEVFALLNPRRASINCHKYSSLSHDVVLAAFASPLGNLPYFRFAKKDLERSTQHQKVAVFLVGGPANAITGQVENDFYKFMRMQLQTYDAVYIPAYYGTAHRSVSRGAVMTVAAAELSYFLDYLKTEHGGRPDIISSSAGGLLAVLIPRDKSGRMILLNPPLTSIKNIYRERDILDEIESDKPPYDVFFTMITGPNDIDNLTDVNVVQERHSTFVKRYFNPFYDSSIFDNMDSKSQYLGGCTFIVVGAEDDYIGRSYLEDDDTNKIFKFLPNTNHDFMDTELERNSVTTTIRLIQQERC